MTPPETILLCFLELGPQDPTRSLLWHKQNKTTVKNNKLISEIPHSKATSAWAASGTSWASVFPHEQRLRTRYVRPHPVPPGQQTRGVPRGQPMVHGGRTQLAPVVSMQTMVGFRKKKTNQPMFYYLWLMGDFNHLHQPPYRTGLQTETRQK